MKIAEMIKLCDVALADQKSPFAVRARQHELATALREILTASPPPGPIAFDWPNVLVRVLDDTYPIPPAWKRALAGMLLRAADRAEQ